MRCCTYDLNSGNIKGEESRSKTERAATYIPTPVRCSIIGEEGLSFLVRNGAGRFPLSIATRIVEKMLFGVLVYWLLVYWEIPR